MFDMLFRALPYFIMRGSKIKFDDSDNFEFKRKKSSDDEVPQCITVVKCARC